MAPGWRWRNVPVPPGHVIALILGLGLHAFVPWPLGPGGPWMRAVGWAVVGAGVPLAGWAVAAARETDLAEPSEIVDRGPYRISRNPMYVAWHALYLGAFAVVGTAWLLALLPIVLVWTHREIVAEERRLAERFGDRYASYRSRTRRYV